MKTLAELASFPLSQAHLCLDCSYVGNSARACPNCASQALMNLAQVMDRPEEKKEGATQ